MNEGSALLRQLVKNATDQKREREDMQTCSNENKYVLEQQSNEIMELKEKVRKLEAKIITVRQRKRDYIKLNMALINDKNQTTVETIRLNAVISRLEKSLDKVRKLEAKIITVRQRKRDYIKLNMALINDKNQTTVEIIRLNAVISRLEKSLDTLVKQSTEQKDKNNFDLIF